MWECLFYTSTHGFIDHPVIHTLSSLIYACYGAEAARILLDSWNVWKRKTFITSSPFYVNFLLELSMVLPYRIYQIRDWMDTQPPIWSYCFISVGICALYFAGRVVAMRAFPMWRVTTALFCIQFMTDVVSVIPHRVFTSDLLLNFTPPLPNCNGTHP